MRTSTLIAPGDPPTFAISDQDDLVPGPGEAVVELVAAALNRRDWWIWCNPGTTVPATLGSDGAGRVRELGTGTSGLRVGDEVLIDAALHWGAIEEHPDEAFEILGSPTRGTFAEQVCVPAINLAPRPQRLDWRESAALSLAGLTAWRATVTHGRAEPGRRLLVTGGGSGVSTFCLQIGAALGADVWVTSGSPDKVARCAELGARGGFDYHDPEWPAQARSATGGHGFDAVIDSFAGDGWSRALGTLARGGRLVSFGDTGGDFATIPVAPFYGGWRSLIGTTMGSPREHRALLDHVEHASWKPVIDSLHPLDELADAAARLTAPDRFGKVVLDLAR